MKKLSLLLALLLVICCGCSGEKSNASGDDDTAAIIAQYLPTDMKLSDKNVEFIGRFKEVDGGYQFAWSGSTIRAGFVGTEISATLELVEQYEHTDYLEVIVDGEIHKTFEIYPNVKRSELLVYDLEYGYHTIEIIKRTEQLSLIAFYGFDYAENVYPAPAPARKDKNIIVIGESITSGYGVMEMNGERDFESVEQDVQHTYGWLVAEALGAEPFILGMSSAGIVKNPISERWNTYGGTMINESYVTPAEDMPDLVIINLGTIDNHGDIPDSDFEIGYTRFIKEVRGVYPDAHILCTVGGITNEPYNVIEKVVADHVAKGDDKLYSYKIISSRDGEGMCGGDFHPNALAHAAMAEELTVFIQNNIEF